jgi:acyl-CoA synthetase (AMP-forming)/AMP-acid ligase II
MHQSRHAATKETIGPACGMHRRDLGVMGRQGYATITGRNKSMVIIGGEKIRPREIYDRDGRLNAAQTAGAAGSAVLRISP